MTRFKSATATIITIITKRKIYEKIKKQSVILLDLNEIVPRMYLGNLEEACNPLILIKFQITHVLSCCHAAFPFEDGIGEFGELLETTSFQIPKYHRISIPDKETVKIEKYFNHNTFDFINDALKNENCRILIHCHAGVSRSSTIFIAWLMSNGSSLDDAYRLLKEKRPIIRPNPGFARALISYQLLLDPTKDPVYFNGKYQESAERTSSSS
jgi:hypothetical protein